MQTVTNFEPRRDINVNHRKENHWQNEWALIDLDAGRCVATLRTYGTSTGGSNSACLWIAAEPHYASGSGRAGGYGYHRPSAAAHDAFRAAGVTLAEPIDGRGDSAIEEAMRALAPVLGVSRPYLHRANA